MASDKEYKIGVALRSRGRTTGGSIPPAAIMKERDYPSWYNKRVPTTIAEFNEIWRYISKLERRIIKLEGDEEE
jgi:hypothetical protein